MIISTLIIHSAIFGFMLFFAAVISPAAIKVLDSNSASTFLRYIFPRIFAFGFLVTLLATITSFIAFSYTDFIFLISIISSILFVVNWLVITPKINSYRDLVLGGDISAKKVFGMLHGVSVGFFFIQMVGSGLAIYLIMPSIS